MAYSYNSFYISEDEQSSIQALRNFSV